MAATASPSPARALSAKALGVLAVVGLVVAFSLSSTLVKRAESPGVLVAFWRMVTVSVVWNARAVEHAAGGSRWRDVRQVLLPGIFFGLNLAVFFAGATHNSVANAALIGSLAPFLIVPVGALAVRRVHRPARAGVRACSRSAASRSCCSARRPTATPRWRATCSASSRCCCWSPTSRRRGTSAARWTSRRSWRRSARSRRVAVLPLALAHGDVFGLSGTGWTFMLILTFTSGVAAQGLLVFAQKTIQIGTIGIAQVAQPALAVVWSFLLLGEVVNDRQVAGHRDRHGRAAGVRRAAPARRSARSRSVMKCDGGRPSRAVAPPSSSGASASSAKTSTGASPSRRASSRSALEPRAGARVAVARVERRQQALAERRLLAAAGLAVPRRRRLERRARRRVAAERAQHAPEMDARERRHAHVAGRLGLARSRARASRAPAS